ncbi:carboxymuconolactone decarboxylase family protein [Saccharopolyspora rhizosphaerae]|uniref:Carboxymuconolactone decarboxylase family protein n=1 Tax=Saccharopolyspora rhizosphaerae TaxID=2492662 RepID=A0A3R8VF08_9PSEU|nr:carboxymuconolactone decarboxylase family protein [Saccharopolyspora rhizosphaerae]RRO16204.1 carboxymuconolactone decarboxylase family protein [Saccharopolyspora rhizosphaerae]
MQARMNNPAMLLPEAFTSIQALLKAVHSVDVPAQILELVHLRSSQINGCSFCVHYSAKQLKQAGMSDDRIWSVAAWREAPWFSDAERAALELAEATTRIADRGEPVDDELFKRLTEHFSEEQIAALTLMIGVSNMFNRINAVTRQPADATF